MRGESKGVVRRAIVDPLFYILTATSVLCAILVSFRASRVEFMDLGFLIWNLFLAWLPLAFSMAALSWAKIAKGVPLAAGLCVCGVGWLLLFPNAPYLMTDLIHLIFAGRWINYDVDGLLLWFDLVLVFLFTWCGLLLGYVSMNQIHAIVRHYWDAAYGWAFVVATSMLGGDSACQEDGLYGDHHRRFGRQDRARQGARRRSRHQLSHRPLRRRGPQAYEEEGGGRRL